MKPLLVCTKKTLQLLELQGHGLPTIDGQHMKSGEELGITLHGLRHLYGELTSRRKYQQLRRAQAEVNTTQQRQLQAVLDAD